MFFRKKTKLRLAYAALAISALSLVAQDAISRSTPAARVVARRDDAAAFVSSPLISRLADSPFPEARSSRMDAAIAAPGPTPQTLPAESAAPPRVYFLTVAVQVNSAGAAQTFSRGTRVQLMREQDDKFLVRYRRTDFLIEKTQVAADLNAQPSRALHSS